MSIPPNTSSRAHIGRLLGLAGRLLGLVLLCVATVSCIVEKRGVVYQRSPAHYHPPVVAPMYQPTYRPPYNAYPRYTQPVYVEERVYPSLPFGARVTYVRGQRCWYHNGSYYRHHPRGTGFILFIP